MEGISGCLQDPEIRFYLRDVFVVVLPLFLSAIEELLQLVDPIQRRWRAPHIDVVAYVSQGIQQIDRVGSSVDFFPVLTALEPCGDTVVQLPEDHKKHLPVVGVIRHILFDRDIQSVLATVFNMASFPFIGNASNHSEMLSISLPLSGIKSFISNGFWRSIA